MNSPALEHRVVPRSGAAVLYELARLAGFQTLTGFLILGLYLSHEIGHEFASVLIWVFAAGLLGLRQVLWVAGRKQDRFAHMPTTKFDLFALLVGVLLAVLGLAVYLRWI